MISGQCNNKRGHGPGLAYCKQHDPITVKAKDDARQAKWEAEWAATLRKAARPKAFKAALEAIADGHNDPRTLAIETLKGWE